jgi:gamma-tubulin complex component 3
LAAIVETALRNTNATGFPPDVLGRLQVELLLDGNDSYQLGALTTDKRTVWDMFVLDYQVPDPLLVIVHPEALEHYKRMFLFLFGLRKVEYLLNLTWRQSAVLQHALQTSAQYNGLTVSTSPEYAQSIVLQRHVSMTRQAMMHFVVNLKSYLMFEVLEGGWKELARTMQEAETLDGAVEAHDVYLEGICRKSFLRTDSTSGNTPLGEHIHTLLGLVSEFCSYQEDVFGDSIEAAERAAQKRRDAEVRLKQGQWGFSSDKEVTEEGVFFGLADVGKMVELDRISKTFSHQITTLLQKLDDKLNGGLAHDEEPGSPVSTPSRGVQEQQSEMSRSQDDLNSLRFLAFQLDCNKFYSIQENE